MAIKVRWMLTFKRRRGLCLGWRTQMGGFNDISPYKNLLSCTFALWLPSAGKESACNVGDLGSIPGLGRSPGEGKGYPLQYSGLENSMDSIVLFTSVAQSCLNLCNPMDCSTPGLPVLHQLLEFIQTHVYRVSDAIQPSHPLSSPFPPTFNLSQDQGLFKWVSSSHHVAKVLEFQLQHQSFPWTPRTDFL